LAVDEAEKRVATFCYRPDRGNKCQAGEATYQFWSLEDGRILFEKTICWQDPRRTFAAFVDDDAVLGYFVEYDVDADGAIIGHTGHVRAMLKQGTVRCVDGLTAMAIAVSPDGKDMGFATAIEPDSAFDLELRASGDLAERWKRRVSFGDIGELSGIELIWSEDSRLFCANFCGSSNRGRLICCEAATGTLLCSVDVPSHALDRDGPKAIVRVDADFDPLEEFGLTLVD
jgi:hypothetical protein